MCHYIRQEKCIQETLPSKNSQKWCFIEIFSLVGRICHYKSVLLPLRFIDNQDIVEIPVEFDKYGYINNWIISVGLYPTFPERTR